MKQKIQVFEYDGKRITFDFSDGEEMVPATEIIKGFERKDYVICNLGLSQSVYKKIRKLN